MVRIRVSVLGSGSSTGVPVIGCNCDVCLSDHPYNKRLRSSILITRKDNQKHLVVDTTPDFRAQILSQNIRSLTKVLYTHCHADHMHGFDDLRMFCFRGDPLDLYLKKEDMQELKQRFSYAFQDFGYSGVVPQVKLTQIAQERFAVWSDFYVEAYVLPHGAVKSTAFRFGKFAYATDFQCFTTEQIEGWKGKIHTMIASGIHMRSHPTHSSIPETLRLFDELEVKRGIITHLSHEVDYDKVSSGLPQGRELAYDGMEFDVEIGDMKG